jgi:hypothetical protein
MISINHGESEGREDQAEENRDRRPPTDPTVSWVGFVAIENPFFLNKVCAEPCGCCCCDPLLYVEIDVGVNMIDVVVVVGYCDEVVSFEVDFLTELVANFSRG